MQKPQNCILVIFGATGDLNRRKLAPALFHLFRHGRLPESFEVLGIGTRPYTDSSLRDMLAEDIRTHLPEHSIDLKELDDFLSHLHYQSLDVTNPENFAALKSRLSELEKTARSGGNHMYYLATSPRLFEVIARNLADQELNRDGEGLGWKRLVVEKPFGYDLKSARELSLALQQVFREDQIYRIDHYLGKETVQNIFALRFANGIFEPLWNRNYIHHIEVTAAESLGVGDRGGYYDGSGALRDMVQNHLLQVVAAIAMEPPSRFESGAVRNEKVKFFQSLCPISPEQVHTQVIRGQYTAATMRGESVPGYREEKHVARDSRTETFLAMKFFVDNWRWGGVPFFIRTGKRLPTRVTEAVIHFKKTPQALFAQGPDNGVAENQLILRIQPDEGILLKFGMKLPGEGFQIKNVDMDFHYSDLGETVLPEAYERLLLDCLLGDTTLYARADSVEACWAFLTPILDNWQNDPDSRLFGYPAGTWGPHEAKTLFDNPGEDWRYPCKNLASDGEYCEL